MTGGFSISLLSFFISIHCTVVQSAVFMPSCYPIIQSHVVLLSVNLDGSNTTSNDNFDEDDLEDKHLLPTSSVGEDTIVKEVHR